MRNLNSFEVASELQRLGFVRVISNAHANGYQHPSSPERVFIKMSKTGAPVREQPFLIHPSHRSSNLWDAIKALTPSAPNTQYKNTNLTGFPKAVGSDSKVAIALDVAAEADLCKLLELLGVETNSPSEQQAQDGAPKLLDTVFTDLDLTETEREALITARIGQGDYRTALIAYWGGCAITGCVVPELLRASHIKPWREASASERLDSYNGLLLTPNLDLAFDQGLISFDDSGCILLSEDLDPDSAAALHIHSDLRLRQIEPAHRVYLAWHREHLFRK